MGWAQGLPRALRGAGVTAPDRPKEQALRGRWDLIPAALCGRGGPAQPGVPVDPVWRMGLRRWQIVQAQLLLLTPGPPSTGAPRARGPCPGARTCV